MSNQPLRFSERKPDKPKSSRLVQLLTGIGKLTYPQKFVFIALIFALPLIAFLPLVFEQSTYIDRYGYKEAQGTIYLRGLWQLTNSLQTLQYTSGEYSKGIGSFTAVDEARADTEADFQVLETVHQQYGSSLALDFDINEPKVQLQDLKANLQDNPKPVSNQLGTPQFRDQVALKRDRNWHSKGHRGSISGQSSVGRQKRHALLRNQNQVCIRCDGHPAPI